MQIKLGGHEYPVATLDTFTIDEAIVLYSYSKLTLNEVMEIEGLHPGVMAGLVHVTIARANPEMREQDIRRQVGMMNLIELASSWSEVASGPPAEPQPAENESNGNGVSSGLSGLNGGDHTPEQPPESGTGQGGLDTGAASDPVTSAA